MYRRSLFMRLGGFHVRSAHVQSGSVISATDSGHYLLSARFYLFLFRLFFSPSSSSLLIYRCRILSSRLINFSSLHSYFVCCAAPYDMHYQVRTTCVKYTEDWRKRRKKKEKKNSTITHCRRMTVVKNCRHTRTSHTLTRSGRVRRFANDFLALIRMDFFSDENEQTKRFFFQVRW